MKAMLFSLCLLFALQDSILAAVTVSSTTQSSSSSGSTLGLTFTNSDASAVCAVTFSVSLPSGTTIASSWNMDAVSGSSSQYTLPSWINIAANGGTYSSTGMTLSGTGTPTFSVDSYSACSSSATTTTTAAAASGTTTTTTTAATTTTTAASGTITTTTSSSSSSSTTLVVSPVYTTKDTCMSESTAYGPITSVLNQPITGSEFTFYGIGGKGACGLDTDTPSMSAAASGNLFNSSAQWIGPSCLSDQRYLLNDPICMNKCIKIEYKGKTLTVPINNECPECAENHVDLSEDAFNWLEPGGGTVGVATGATLTYIECS